MNKKLLAFHSSPPLKEEVLKLLEKHLLADEIIKGQYWENGKGCAVGCLTHKSRGGHRDYPKKWGIPEDLAFLEDEIFEGLPNLEAKKWPLEFMRAIPVGADLGRVWVEFAIIILSHPLYGVLGSTPDGVRPPIQGVVSLLQRVLSGEIVGEPEWKKVHSQNCRCMLSHTGRNRSALECARMIAMSMIPSDLSGRVADASAILAEISSHPSPYLWQAETLLSLLQKAPLSPVQND